MPAGEHSRIKTIFGEALDRQGPERAAYLEKACAGDPEMRRHIDDLLAAAEKADPFLSEPTVDAPSIPEPPLAQPPLPAPLSSAAVARPPRPGSGAPATEAAGTRIGPYKLLQLIGEGGFGSVFMAEQEHPVRRRVALKIIKLGMDTRAVVARFEQERQALAIMDHPSIAKVFDAGTTETGRPYFVMELVKGDPITAYCDAGKLSPGERLELFAQVCHAVQHAHTKGIIHRDIKPSNVMVTVVDGRPVPKVIDFGIAKATSARLTEKTVFTEFRQLIGTPEYMSPEQAGMSGVDIDTRSDVYSLGVLLYELLVGVTPFDARRLRSAAWGELQRMIREEEPAKPSTRLSTMKETIASVAAHRRTEPARLSRLVRGDLDWIVMKCLEKNRARRYETASGLAADVGRHLAGEAVLAAPPGAAYKVGKFVRRHRFGVFAAAALGAVLALGVAGTGLGLWKASLANTRLAEALQRARAQRDVATGSLQGIAKRFASEPALASPAPGQPEIALGGLGAGQDDERSVEALGQAATKLVDGLVQARGLAADEAQAAHLEAAKARSVSEFLQHLLEGVSPTRARANRDVTVRQIVDQSAKDLDEGRVKIEPEIEATVRGTIGKLYWALGDDDHARHHLQHAIALGEAGALPRHDIANLRQSLGDVLRDLKDLDGAAAAYQQALGEISGATGTNSTIVVAIDNSLAGIAMERGRLDEAAGLYDKALAILDAQPREHSQDLERQTMEILNNQAVLADHRGHPERSETLFRQILQRTASTLPADDPFVAETNLNLGVAILKQGRSPEALPYLRSALELCRTIHGDQHPQTLEALTQLGNALMFVKAWPEAQERFLEVIRTRRELPVDARGNSTDAMRGYCIALEYDGKPADAEPMRRELVDIARAGRPRTELATHLANLGFNLLMQQRWTDAETPLRECLTIRRELIKPDSPQFWSVRSTESMLGEARCEEAAALAATDPVAAAARLAEVEALITPAAESDPADASISKPLPGAPDRKRLTLVRAVKLYTLWQRLNADPAKAEKAAQWQRKLDEYGPPADER